MKLRLNLLNLNSLYLYASGIDIRFFYTSMFQTEEEIITPTKVNSGDSFALVDDYGWLSIHPTTGVITATSTDLISGRFEVSVEITNGGSTKVQDLTISVYYANSETWSKNDTSFALGEVNKSVPISGNSLQTNYKVPASIGDSFWHYINFYKTTYSHNDSDIVIVDDKLETTTVLEEDGKGYNYNLTHGVITDQGKFDINVLESATFDRKIFTYDPATKTVAYNTVVVPTSFGGEESQINLNRYYPNEAFINGNDGSYLKVGKYNTLTRAFTDLGQVGSSRTNPRALGIAGDNTYFYSVVGREPNVQLYQTTHDGVTETLLATTTDNLGDIELQQYRWGVRAKFKGVSGYADGYWYIYNDTITDGTDADNPPWTPGDAVADFSGPEEYVRGHVSDIDIKSEDSNGDVIAYVDNDAGTTEYNYNIRTYPASLFNITTATNNNVVIAGADYAGMVEVDTSDYTQYNFNAHASRIRFTKIGIYIYFSGYPSWSTYRYNTVTNEIKFLGYAGGIYAPSSGHFVQGMANHNGIVYETGVQHRIGESGCIAYFDPNNFAGTIGGFSNQNDPSSTPDLSDYGFNNCVVIGDELVVPAYIISGSSVTEALLYIFDIATEKFVRTIPMGTDITTTGFIVGVSDTEIFGITAKPDGSAVMYKVDISTDTIVYKKYPADLRSTLIQDDKQVIEQSIFFEDGFVYSNIYDGSSTYHMVKIDHIIGGIEFLGTIANEPFTITPNGNGYIVSSAGDFKEKALLTSVDNMPMVVLVPGAEMMTYPDFSGDEFVNGSDWTLGGGQWTFADTGGSDHFYSNIGITADVTYRVEIDVESVVGSSTVKIRFGSSDDVYFDVGESTTDITIDSGSVSGNISVLVGSRTGIVLNSLSIKPLVNSL